MKLFGKPLLLVTFFFLSGAGAQAQLLKKLGKSAERAAERTVERRVERETSKKTDAALDSILQPGSNEKTPDPQVNSPAPPPSGDAGNSGGTSSQSSETIGVPGASNTMEVYSKFDFVPGDKILYFDDFANDFIGDFPAKWNTNGSGEVVTVSSSPQKWLKLLQGYGILYIPDVPQLPEDYTIEFDLLTRGIDQQTNSTSQLTVHLSNDEGFGDGTHYVWAAIPLGQYSAFDIWVRNYSPGKGTEINSGIKADIREDIMNIPHISIAVNGQRFRLWVNENKYVDIPRFIPEGSNLSTLKFNLNHLKDGKENLFITNLKVAQGGVDLRRKLLSEGSVSTNGILFDSGSANIQPQSMGIILQISQVLQQESGMKLMIEGHTDADGAEDANLSLSQKRAEAVKNALVNIYSVDPGRLQTIGKGESVPVGDNNTADGKAENRRVVFNKI
jgi:outer membrane protein OmpA-like peptidoglycan-associated protein